MGLGVLIGIVSPKLMMHDVQLRSDITNRVVIEVTVVRPFPSVVLVCINDDF